MAFGLRPARRAAVIAAKRGLDGTLRDAGHARGVSAATFEDLQGARNRSLLT